MTEPEVSKRDFVTYDPNTQFLQKTFLGGHQILNNLTLKALRSKDPSVEHS